ncbi:MAG: hypothetical protein ACXVJ8_13715 [Candidatus Angelobacter sp.]
MEIQDHSRQHDPELQNRPLTEGPSERELHSGKVPLRPIHRAGFLVLGVTFVVFTCFLAVGLMQAAWGQNIFVKCLLLSIGMCWFLLFFTLGRRLIWAALIAPSESDDEEDKKEDVSS